MENKDNGVVVEASKAKDVVEVKTNDATEVKQVQDVVEIKERASKKDRPESKSRSAIFVAQIAAPENSVLRSDVLQKVGATNQHKDELMRLSTRVSASCKNFQTSRTGWTASKTPTTKPEIAFAQRIMIDEDYKSNKEADQPVKWTTAASQNVVPSSPPQTTIISRVLSPIKALKSPSAQPASPTARINIGQSRPASLQGWLKKKGKDGIIKRWKARWFQFQDTKLYYFLSRAEAKQGEGKAKGFIDMRACLEIQEVSDTQEEKWDFCVVTQNRRYLLKADSEEDYSKWIEGLRLIIKHLQRNSTDVDRASRIFTNDQEIPVSNPVVATEEDPLLNALCQKIVELGEYQAFRTSTVYYVAKPVDIVGRLIVTNYRVLFVPHPKQPPTSDVFEIEPDDTNSNNSNTKMELFHTIESGDDDFLFSKLLTLINDKRNSLRKMRHPTHNYCLLSAAVENKRINIVNLLLKEGCEPNRVGDVHGFTPFHAACARGNLSICMALLRHGAAVNIATKDQSYPLHYLVRLPFSTILEDVLEVFIKRGADLDVRNIYGETPLHLAVDFNTIKYLIEHKANINAADGRGETCLHKVVFRAVGKPPEEIKRIMTYLIESGIDQNVVGLNGTAYDFIEKTEQLHYLKPLFSASSTGAPSISSLSFASLSTMQFNSIQQNRHLRNRFNVTVVSIPLLLIDSIREVNKNKSQYVDITTKNLRHCRFSFQNDTKDERKIFVDMVRMSIPKSLKEIFAYSFVKPSTHGLYNPKNMDVYRWKGVEEPLESMCISHRSVILMACGKNHCAAVSIDGDIWIWGSGAKNQLGLGEKATDHIWSPQKIPLQHKIQNVACSHYQSAAITDQGELLHWGTFGDRVIPIPTLVKGLETNKVTMLALGHSHICAVVVPRGTGPSKIFSWGNNNRGQLGLGDTEPRNTPTLIKTISDAHLIAAGANHNVAVVKRDQIYAWGKNEKGQLGVLPTKLDSTLAPSCVEALKGKPIRDIACGHDFSIVLTQSGEVFSWGRGKYGALGHGDEHDVYIPKPIEELKNCNIEKVACGNSHCIACSETSLWTWGSSNPEEYARQGVHLSPYKIENIGANRIFQVACGGDQTFIMLDEDPLDLLAEYRRQGLPNCFWRLCLKNINYEMCASYPRFLIVPASMDDDEIVEAGKFRSQGRLPVLTYLHAKNNATITRSSQPNVGLSGRRSEYDEKLLRHIAEANPNGNMLYLMDARPKANAVANQAVGAGYEHTENYKNIKIQFLGIENIHLMRDSINKITSLCKQRKLEKSTSSWLSDLEATKWTEHIETILSAAKSLAELVDSGKSALVHCSDGWDRTTQLVCLAQIMLDPYFRTIVGFQVLIEKDWLTFGHRCGDRLGHFESSGGSQVSPILLQFLDCVWQITQQFPTAFEFNTHFLIKIFDHSHSGKYGTFFGNSDKERHEELLKTTPSLWRRLRDPKKMDALKNPNYVYTAKNDQIFPATNLKAIRLWREFFFRWDSKYK